jgi:outer membrane receptor for ferrienterochelin and colicins
MNSIFTSSICNKRSAGLSGAAAAMFVVLLSSPLHGQSVDYGALEQLFKEPVTNSVDGSPQRVSDVAATMVIITADDIRRSGAKDIPGVLRHVGGVDTLEWGNDDIDVSVRGYDQALSPRLLVLVDGRQVYSDDYGYTPWSSVPVELAMIRQIEIIKGPSSALFGFNAAGGVINIITYNPLYDKVDTVSSTGGTQGLVAGSIVTTHKFGSNVGVRLSIGGYSNNDFSTPIPVAMAITPREHEYRGAINLDTVFRINEKMQLGVEATYSVSKLNTVEPSYEIDNEHHLTDSVKAQFAAESGFGLVHGTVYTNWSNVTAAPGFADQTFHFNNRVTVAELDDIFNLGAHHILRAAAEYRFTTENTTSTPGANVNDSVWAASGMWNWTITPAVTLTNALRVDHLSFGRNGFVPPGYPFTNSDWNRSITYPSFNSGLVWKPSERDSLRLMASRGAQLPSLVDSGALILITPYFKTTGSPFLNPAIVTNYEIGWDHAMDGPHILFRGSAFHQHSEDLRAIFGGTVMGSNGPYSLPLNIGSSDANGLELGLKGILLTHYRWSVDYRPEWIKDHFVYEAQGGANFTDYDDTTPVHLVQANLGWANRRWELDGYLHYQSGDFGIQKDGPIGGLIPVAGFVSLDGRVAYNLTSRMTWSVSGQNLTHASQLQTSGPAVERRVLGTMSINF